MNRTSRRRRGTLAPHPELWEAVGRGEGLRSVLEDFYGRVYTDPQLAPFFAGVTKERAVDKQHGFLRQIFTGERVYFGDRPHNAHHWMVISHELFDYREELMASCLRRHGVPEEHVAEWRKVEEVFRKQIVKTEPVMLKRNGVEFPLDGHGQVTITTGSLCDVCAAEISVGTVAAYHLRTGTLYCPHCGPSGVSVTGEQTR